MNQKKPIVLALCSWYPNRLDPTLGNFIHEHLELVSDIAEVRAVFVTGDAGISEPEWVEPLLPNYRAICRYIPSKGNGFKPVALFFAWKQAAFKILEGQKPNFIHVHVAWPAIIPAYYLSRKWNVPIVLTEHWTGFLPERRQHIGWLKNAVLRFFLPKCKMITSVGKSLADALKPWAPKVNTAVIPNAIAPVFFKMKYVKPQHPLFLHVSNGSKQKNLKWLLPLFFEFAANHPNAVLTIVGEEGEDKTWARQEASSHSLGKQLIFHPVMEPHALAEMMSRSTALLHPALYETQGLTVFEAAAMGLPIIANDLDPFASLKDFGIFLHVNDGSAWLSAMEQMVEGAFQKGEKRFPSSYQPEYVKQQWMHVYHKMEAKHA